MKFKDLPYTRPDVPKLLDDLNDVKKEIEEAESYQDLLDAFRKMDRLNSSFRTESSLCYIRHTIDTRDEFYSAENDYLNEQDPVVANALNDIYKAILASPYAEELKKDVPAPWFYSVENALKSIRPEIIPEMQEDTKLATQYQALIASAEIPFDGETYTLASLQKKMTDEDPDVRKRATIAHWKWFEDHEKEIGEIYDQMVKVRTRMANKLGHDTYTPLGYIRMERFDYDQNDVEQYRKNVLEDVVPVAVLLFQKQAELLGRDDWHLPAWDEKIEFLNGNPEPKIPADQMVGAALEMYKELSPETGEFFQHMSDEEMMDLEAKPGKAAGGYCTGLPDYKTPFIFANGNGTKGDVETLTHEAGHAFQCWSSRDIQPTDCMWPTMESAEIHSMSMEFFTWPWMDKFFKEDADKYRYSHLGGTVKFIPYGVLVDHFQHEVYAHPEWSHEDRMHAWRELEKQYLPWKNYEEIDVLERGGWWMRQLHIFMNPFYYIDYTLAQVCAQQFWKRLQDGDPEAFEDYKKLCSAGGTKTFRQLVELAGLKVPFEPGCLKDTMQSIAGWISSQDLTNF